MQQRSWILGASLVGLAVVAGSGGVARAEKLLVCVDDPAGEALAARSLEGWLAEVRLELVSRRTCARGSNGRPTFWFEAQRGRVYAVLAPRTGQRLRREVPWVVRAEAVLSQLHARGRLSELSVLLEALLAERGVAWRVGPKRPPPRAAVPPAAEPDEPAAAIRAPAARNARPLATRPSTARSMVSSPTSPPPPAPSSTSPSVAPPAPPPRVAARAAVPSPAAAPPRRAERPAASVASAVPPPPAVPSPPSVEDRGGPSLGLRRSASPRGSGWLDDLRLQAHLAGRYRSTALFTAELGGALRFRSLFVRAGYQLPAEWTLEGRPVQVTGVPLGAGWQPRLFRRGPVRFEALGAFLVEHLTVRRLDLAAAEAHSFVDLGLALGLAVTLRLPARLELGLHLEGSWFPAGRTVEVPAGPSAPLSRLAAQSVLTLAFGGGR